MQKKQTSTSALLLLSGPSGVGKGTIIKKLQQHIPHLHLAVSLTTRPKRKGEIHGKDYYFCSKNIFFEKKEKGELLEYEHVHDAHYATLKSETIDKTDKHPIVLVEADVNGVYKLKQLGLSTCAIFLLPPSIERLKKRLEKRKSESKHLQDLRLSRIQKECGYMKYYDYLVVNDSVETCLKEILNIFQKKFKIG